MPGAPGMLSIASPFSASRSATWSGRTPMNVFTFSASYHSSSLAGLSMETCSFTSCSMSLSLETITTSMPAASARRARVPITSSASKPGIFQNGNPHGFEDAADEGNLVEQVGRRFGAIGLVLGELLHAVGGFAALEDRGDVGRLVLLRQLPQHVVEDVDRFGGEAGAGAHGRRARPRARVVGAEDKAERIDEKQLLSGHCAHHTIAGDVVSFASGKPGTDSEFPANGAGNSCQSPVCGRGRKTPGPPG